MSDKKEEWEKAFHEDEKLESELESIAGTLKNGLLEAWLCACEYQQKKLDIAVEALRYVKSGISHIESKTECRHCAIDEALEKIEGEK